MADLLIIGGGVGGLATAACLQARGIRAHVYERTNELREVGAAIGVWPNATRVLKHLGVLEDLVRRAYAAPAGALRNRRGALLKQMVSLESDVPSIFAHRADLHGAILSVIPEGSISLNKQCLRIEHESLTTTTPPRVRAVFADGTTSDWADGLIAADGIRSVIRAQIHHDGPPTYRGYIAWRGVASFDAGQQIVGETWGRGARFGFIPLGQGRVGWWAAVNKTESEAQAIAQQHPAAWKDQVLAAFRHWHDPIERLLRATPDHAWLCNPIADRPALGERWGDRNITLLGDAAHPTTPNLGQGACMAIEDAAVLAHALAREPAIEKAFRTYERARAARTALIVRDSLKFGRIGQWEGTLSCALRDWLMRLAPARALARQFNDLWRYDAWNAPFQ